MKTFYYKLLVMFFYYVGDIACRFDSEKAFEIYQKAMKLSVEYDEKIGFWWWKEPINSHESL
jgi:hypothetical protein